MKSGWEPGTEMRVRTEVGGQDRLGRGLGQRWSRARAGDLAGIAGRAEDATRIDVRTGMVRSEMGDRHWRETRMQMR